VATPATKTATTAKTATPVAANKTASPAKIATTTAPKAASPAKTAAPAAKADKATAPVTAAKIAAPVVKKAVAKTEVPALSTSKVTFVLPKEAVENAETVAVLGDFNNWQGGIVLTKQKDGSFKAAVELEKGRSYEYRFLINGEKWENDWAAEAYAPTPFGAYNSVVTA
jgi:1,4-alpha-glucan branching enzyme